MLVFDREEGIKAVLSHQGICSRTGDLLGAQMPCKICASANLQNLIGELTASLPCAKNLNASPLYLCQEILVCLDCGFAELRVPPAELQQLMRAKQIDK